MKKQIITLITVIILITSLTNLILTESEGETITTFKDGSSEKIIVFTTPGTNFTTNLELRKNLPISTATLNITGLNDGNGNYPSDVTLDIGYNNKPEWAFIGEGYGFLGCQNCFNDDSVKKSITFDFNGHNNSASIRLPKNATINSATLELRNRYIPNYGLKLECTSISSTWPYICAGDYSGDPDYHPKLIIKYDGNTLPLQPGSEGKDAMVVQGSSDNYGDHEYLIQNWGSTTSVYGYIEFDLSSIPPDAVITSCNLHLYHTWNSLSNSNWAVYPVLESWAEATISGTNQPGVSDIPEATVTWNGNDVWRIINITNLATRWFNQNISNIKLDVGNDGDIDWNYPGTLPTAPQKTSDLSAELNSLLSTIAPTYIDDYGNEFVDIPLNISADSPGSKSIELSNLTITYTWETSVTINPHSGNLVNELNNLISDPLQSGNITLPVAVKSNNAGKIRISNLYIEYNAPPKSITIPNTYSIDEDTVDNKLIDLTKYFTDDYDSPDTLIYNIVSNSESSVVPVNIFESYFLAVDALTGSENDNWFGTLNVIVNAIDSGGLTTESNIFMITVNLINDEPYPNLENQIPDITIEEGGSNSSIDLDAKNYFIDIEDDKLYFTYEIDPENLYNSEDITVNIDSDNVLEITGNGDWFGSNIPVWIYCDDDKDINTIKNGTGNYTYQELLVNVTPISDPPKWSKIPDIIKAEDTNPSLLLDYYNLCDYVEDSDTEDELLIFSILKNSNKIIDVKIDENEYIDITVPENYYGATTVTVRADDSKFYADTEFDIIIESVNDHPTLTIDSHLEGDVVNGTILIYGSAHDVENTIQIIEIEIGDNEWLPVVDNANWTNWSYTWNTQEVEDGIYKITLRVFDGEIYSSKTINLTCINHGEIIDGNIIPLINILEPKDNEIINGIVTIRGTAKDLDGTVQKVWIKIGDDPGRSWDIAQGADNWTYNWDTTQVSDGNHIIYVRAFDGSANSTIKSIIVTVDNAIGGGGSQQEPEDEDKSFWTTGVILTIAFIIILIIISLIIMKRTKKGKEEATVEETESIDTETPQSMDAVAAKVQIPSQNLELAIPIAESVPLTPSVSPIESTTSDEKTTTPTIVSSVATPKATQVPSTPTPAVAIQTQQSRPEQEQETETLEAHVTSPVGGTAATLKSNQPEEEQPSP